MLKRLKAVNTTVRTGLSIFELIIAFAVVLKFVGTNFIDWLTNNLRSGPFSPPGNHYAINLDRIKGPVTFILIVLAFMLFGYIMILFFSKAVERNEKRINNESEDIY